MHAPGGKTSWSPYGHVGQVCTSKHGVMMVLPPSPSAHLYATRQASEHMYDNSNKIGGASSGIPASSRTNLPPRAPRYRQAPDTLPFHEYSHRRYLATSTAFGHTTLELQGTLVIVRVSTPLPSCAALHCTHSNQSLGNASLPFTEVLAWVRVALLVVPHVVAVCLPLLVHALEERRRLDKTCGSAR